MAAKPENNKQPQSEDLPPVCGIIMPIATTDGYSPTHWAEVLEILNDVIKDISYKPSLVSEADDVGIIHNRIVTNIAENPIVICDVSSKNPNVMFELGLRLAFDKPTVIIKDERTPFTFDAGVIEHISYPSSLHFHAIVAFKEKLKKKLLGTIEAAKDESYSTFLKNFKSYKREIQSEKVTDTEYLIKELERIVNNSTPKVKMSDAPTYKSLPDLDYLFNPVSSRYQLTLGKITEHSKIKFKNLLDELAFVKGVNIKEVLIDSKVARATIGIPSSQEVTVEKIIFNSNLKIDLKFLPV